MNAVEFETVAENGFIYIPDEYKDKIDNRKIGNSIILNPGEACGYLTEEATFAILDLKTGEVKIERT